MRRLFGWIFVGLALVALGYGAVEGPLADEPFRWFAIGELWAELHRNSLIGLNSFTEKNISPAFWDSFIFPVLTWNAALTFGIIGIVLLIWARRKRAAPRKSLIFPRR